MKISIKIILPIVLITALLILLNGCLGTVPDDSPGFTPGSITGRIMVPIDCTECQTSDCIPKSNDGVPSHWIPVEGAIVTVIPHATLTDEDGYYTLSNIEPGYYYVITATFGNLVLKDIVEPPGVKAGKTYKAGTANCESTALGLIVEALLDMGLDSEDIELALEIIKENPKFDELVDIICCIIEDCGNVTLICGVDELIQELIDDEPGYTCPPPDDDEPGYTCPPSSGGPTVSISLTKEVDADCYTPEGTLVYTLTVTNTGGVALTNVTLNDSLLGIDESVGTLAVGGSWTEDYEYEVPAEFEGPLTNSAEVSGTGCAQTVSATASVLLLDCTIPTGAITITKEVTGDGNPQEPGKEFSFTITGPSFSTPGSFTLKAGETKGYTGLALGDYLITELGAGTGWTTTVTVDGVADSNSCTVTLADGGDITVTFTNEYDETASPTAAITITKVVPENSGDPEEPSKVFSFTITGPEGFSADSFDLQAGGTKGYTDIPIGAYLITELGAGTGWTTTVSGGTNSNPCTVTLADGGDITVTFTNEYDETASPTGAITITKVVPENSGDPEEPSKVFSFTITGPEGFSADSFDLQAGGTKGYTDIPIGDYLITELSAGTGWTTTVSGGTNSNPCTVTLADGGDITVTFTNEYDETASPTGAITITKVVPENSGDPEEPSKVFSFTITGPEGFSADSFDLQAGGTKGYTDIPIGAYLITELGAGTGWTTTVSGGTNSSNPCTVVLADGGDITVTFTNEYDETASPTGAITITKVVPENSGDPEEPSKVFSFTITGPEGFSADSFDLQAGGTKGYTDIPIGAYLITELSAGTGWTTTVSGGTNSSNPCTVVLADGGDITVTFTNEYTTHELPHAISHVVLLLDDATTVKIDNYGGEIKDPSDPWKFDGCYFYDGATMITLNIIDYIIKAGPNHYTKDGILMTAPPWPSWVTIFSGGSGNPSGEYVITPGDISCT